MAMHNPPHPGEFIQEVYLEPNGLSGRELAATHVVLRRQGQPRDV
jgi:plasmid maintenance system antidote protein VapI